MPRYWRWLIILFVSLGLIIGFTAFHSQKADAAEPTSISTSIDIVKSAPASFTGKVVKPFWLVLPGYCYWSIHGDYKCYRYACTDWERWFYGCTNGYYTVTTRWYA